MLRLIVFLIILAAIALGMSLLADLPGNIALDWGNTHIETSLLVGILALAVVVIVLASVWNLLRFVLHIPSLVGLALSARHRVKGYAALSRGLVALGAGDQKAAHLAAREAERHLRGAPLTLLLKAQAAQMAGDRQTAEATFREMTNNAETRILGLRGLHLEARRRGDMDAAHEHAKEAARLAAVPWASEAALDHFTGKSDWASALQVIDRSLAARHIEKPLANRQRAVLRTAMALDMEQSSPQEALALAREAARLAPDLEPASALAARLYVRQHEPKKARKLIESAWSVTPHPELARIYLDLPGGDKASERLSRAETLLRLTPDAPEACLALARAAISARDIARAEDVLAPLTRLDGAERPTRRACLARADLEEARGNAGAAREWLARAARAPRDEAWIADGFVTDVWAPVSPVTGRLDAFRWARPQEQIAEFADEIRPATETPPEAKPVAAPAVPLSAPVIFPQSNAPDDPGPALDEEALARMS